MLEIRNLNKTYEKNKVLNNLSFIAEEGRITVLSGNNGSGKTTTFRMISGVIKREKESVLFNGHSLKRTEIGYLPEERGLYQNLTVRQQLNLFARLKDIDDNQTEYFMNKWLKIMKCEDKADQKIKTLSKGNQQKIQFISAVINEPDILILDEPFTAMDKENVILLQQILLKMKNENKIIILSSHQLDIVEEIFDDILILDNGRIIRKITREEIIESDKKTVEIQCDEDFYCSEDYIDTVNGICISCNSFREAVLKAQKYRSYESVRSVSIRNMKLTEYIGSK